MAEHGQTAGTGQAGVPDAEGAAEAAEESGPDVLTAELAARDTVERALEEAGLEWESPQPGTYVAKIPGTRKLSTTCSLIVGRHTLSLNAFVVRHPDENEEAVYRWLLERNLRLYGVAYAIDRLGDVYLTGRVPLAAVTVDEIDRLLGAVLENADGSFNTLLELGFAASIRKEYAWRVSRGESTRNLDAFTHLTGADKSAARGD
ncbi:YbjN domain-containing protein [Streptomyces sp. NPDC006733]|uniref:YbjN domain-containing protein n=1 Tax=Streptomyces sp. NPDC006733 TaxID=3155460 RepID=UPI0033E1B76F